MKKTVLLFIILLSMAFGSIFANEIFFTVEVHGVAIGGGAVIGGIHSKNTYNNKDTLPEYTFQGIPENGILNFNLRIPAGEYVIQIYQDSNNNGHLDFGLFNIPKEPVGISNWNGRGIPGNFNRHKVIINNGTIIIVTIGKTSA